MSEKHEDLLFTDTPVDSYRSASLNSEPLVYPGERPPASFITDGELVSPIFAENHEGQLDFTVVSGGQEIPVNEYLTARGAPLMEDRIPVISFGANMCPGSLKSKFTKVGRPDALVVPTIYTELPSHDVVWSAGPGINGNFIAILYQGEETAQTDLQVGISFLTREQLLVLHATEMNYELREVPVEIAGQKIKTFFYAGTDKVFVENGHPVAVGAVPASGRTLDEASTTEMLQKILTGDKVKNILHGLGLEVPESDLTAQDYVDLVRDSKQLKIEKPKTRLKTLVNELMDASSLSREVEISNWPTG